MAKNNDCIVAECDRCGRFAWYTPSNADALKNDWWDVQRLDADGNQLLLQLPPGIRQLSQGRRQQLRIMEEERRQAEWLNS